MHSRTCHNTRTRASLLAQPVSSHSSPEKKNTLLFFTIISDILGCRAKGRSVVSDLTWLLNFTDICTLTLTAGSHIFFCILTDASFFFFSKG